MTDTQLIGPISGSSRPTSQVADIAISSVLELIDIARVYSNIEYYDGNYFFTGKYKDGHAYLFKLSATTGIVQTKVVIPVSPAYSLPVDYMCQAGDYGVDSSKSTSIVSRIAISSTGTIFLYWVFAVFSYDSSLNYESTLSVKPTDGNSFFATITPPLFKFYNSYLYIAVFDSIYKISYSASTFTTVYTAKMSGTTQVPGIQIFSGTPAYMVTIADFATGGGVSSDYIIVSRLASVTKALEIDGATVDSVTYKEAKNLIVDTFTNIALFNDARSLVSMDLESFYSLGSLLLSSDIYGIALYPNRNIVLITTDALTVELATVSGMIYIGNRSLAGVYNLYNGASIAVTLATGGLELYPHSAGIAAIPSTVVYRTRDSITAAAVLLCTLAYSTTLIPPMNVQIARGATEGAAVISWSNFQSGEVSTDIEISTDGITFSRLASVSSGAQEYSITGLISSTRYYFRLRELGPDGYGPYSDSVSILFSWADTSLQAPNSGLTTPVGFDAENELSAPRSYFSGSAVKIEWTYTIYDKSGFKINNITGFKVYRDGSLLNTGADPNARSYTDNTIVAGTIYTYTVKAYNSVTESSVSGAYIVDTGLLLVPSAPTLFLLSARGSEIQVGWTFDSNATHYVLQRRNEDSSAGWVDVFTSNDNTEISYTDTGVRLRTTASRLYDVGYRVFAVNSHGDGAYSIELVVGKDTYL